MERVGDAKSLCNSPRTVEMFPLKHCHVQCLLSFPMMRVKHKDALPDGKGIVQVPKSIPFKTAFEKTFLTRLHPLIQGLHFKLAGDWVWSVLTSNAYKEPAAAKSFLLKAYFRCWNATILTKASYCDIFTTFSVYLHNNFFTLQIYGKSLPIYCVFEINALSTLWWLFLCSKINMM